MRRHPTVKLAPQPAVFGSSADPCATRGSNVRAGNAQN